MEKERKFQFGPFIISILIPLAVGAIGSFLTIPSVKTWYAHLNKPALNPPDNIFGPVWTTLYVLIGLSAYLVWKNRKEISNYQAVAALYFVQLLLNLGWSFIFFNQHLLAAALIEIIGLLVVIIINAIVFYRISKLAGWLFLPYILWVCFATYLTYSIYSLN